MINLNGLTSLTDINSMLESANRERVEQEERRESLQNRIDRTISNLAAIAEDTAEVEAEIATLTAERATLTPGTAEAYRKEAALFRAQGTKRSIDANSLSPSYTEIYKQKRLHEIEKVDVLLPVIVAYITALETRRTELQAS